MSFVSHLFRWLSVFVTYSYVTSHPRFGGLNYKYLLSHSSCRSGIQEQLTSVVWLQAPLEVAAKMSARAAGQTLGWLRLRLCFQSGSFTCLASQCWLLAGGLVSFPHPSLQRTVGGPDAFPPRARQTPFQRGVKVTLGTQRCFGRFSQILVLYFLFWGGLVFFFFPPNIILTVILECCWGYFFKKES